jgi:DNA-binding response OmpR family regulator
MSVEIRRGWDEMVKQGILVVDDDVLIRKFVRANLVARGYNVQIAGNGKEALDSFRARTPDLVILDIMMPLMDGFETCRLIREKSGVPIIMLSAREDERDKIRCLELGADDYLLKPFSLNELLWRVKAILRRSGNSNKEGSLMNYHNGDLDLTVNYDSRKVLLKGKEIDLTSTEFKILSYLTMNVGRIISPEFILEKVWGQKQINSHRVLWVNMCRLRRKLACGEDHQEIIKTKPGLGYFVK